MEQYQKYSYPEPIPIKDRQWPDQKTEKAPIWTSVDLRDGNQALPIPMNPQKKLEYFNLLVKIGFKEIEVGFPSASQDDFDFVRQLIEENLIPDDVRISVLTQARANLINRTVDSLKGAKRAIVHCYVATSDLHGRFVFGRDRDAVKKMAVDGTRMIVDAIEQAGMAGRIGYEFSPEEFTDSDIDFVIEVCEAVKEAWGVSEKQDFMLNLPATVERRPAYQYADMIEYFCRNYKYRTETTISLHAHNDQGCAVAATEMALLAGADRVEGTLFGHGERTGNLDVATLALNLMSRGIDPCLDFSDMSKIVRVVENASGIEVHPRHPYAGQLVFTAFSGSHQDAIRKGMDIKTKIAKHFGCGWKIPYLHIDPADIGRSYEKLIRINSQSGKGGIAFLLENEFGIYPPKAMHPEIGKVVQQAVDASGNEIDSNDLRCIFEDKFVNVSGKYRLLKYKRIEASNPDLVAMKVIIRISGKKIVLEGEGNGPISAVVHALKSCDKVTDFVLDDFSERSLGRSADAVAIAFVGIRLDEQSNLIYGAGENSNIDRAAINALFCALNRADAV
ncbi:MAG: 2-isopropylmalate synthase [Victivallaceae bacterium]|nr:2-isopropylmalate synthase [Victivallaceae bacterium]